MSVRNVLTDVFLVLGVSLVLVSCLGVLAFRSAHDRLHYGAPSTLGAVFIAVAVLVKDSFSMVGDKALLISIFLLVATPIVTHSIGRAARSAEHGRWTITPDEKIDIDERAHG